MNKILHVVGTRPQYIKLFPLWSEINEQNVFEQLIYDTGQHYDNNMSGNLIKEFGFKNIEIGNISGFGPEKQIPKMIENIWEYVNRVNPKYVFIYGDTNSTLAAAIVCAKLEVPFGHIEAGVRTERHVGIQEGINRVVADQLSTHNFCTTEQDLKNISLKCERSESHLVGDLMYDAFHRIGYNRAENPDERKGILVTIHRAENVDIATRRSLIIEAIVNISKSKNVIMPLHPRLKAKASTKELDKLYNSNISVVDPLKYSEIVSLLNEVEGVVTDSGGLPKDAAYAGISSVVFRDDPIWDNLYELGYIHTINSFESSSPEELSNFCLSKTSGELSPYRCELAANKIIKVITSHLGD